MLNQHNHSSRKFQLILAFLHCSASILPLLLTLLSTLNASRLFVQRAPLPLWLFFPGSVIQNHHSGKVLYPALLISPPSKLGERTLNASFFLWKDPSASEDSPTKIIFLPQSKTRWKYGRNVFWSSATV